MAKLIIKFNDVVIDHASGLHMRIDNGGPYELEAAFFEVSANFI